MRSLLFASLLACACTPVDSNVGTFGVTVTGTDTQTAPTMATNTVNGSGTVSINANKLHDGYLVTFGQDDANSNYVCALTAKKSTSTDTPMNLDLADGQICHIGGFTATTTSGTLSLDKDTMNTVTMTLAYTYAGTVLGFNVSGTGTRTYTGARK